MCLRGFCPFGELRELARGIHPTLLRDEGLTAAVEALARRAPVPVTVQNNAQEVANAAKQSVCIADLVDNVHAVVHE
jgi:signal transduction histidine kinase